MASRPWRPAELDAGRRCGIGTDRLPEGVRLPAPRWPIPNDPKLRQIPTHSFADVLNLIGYAQPSNVHPDGGGELIDAIGGPCPDRPRSGGNHEEKDGFVATTTRCRRLPYADPTWQKRPAVRRAQPKHSRPVNDNLAGQPHDRTPDDAATG